MRIFGMILATVGAAIMVFGFLSAGTVAQDPVKEFIWSVLFGGPIAALGILIVVIRKPEKRAPK